MGYVPRMHYAWKRRNVELEDFNIRVDSYDFE